MHSVYLPEVKKCVTVEFYLLYFFNLHSHSDTLLHPLTPPPFPHTHLIFMSQYAIGIILFNNQRGVAIDVCVYSHLVCICDLQEGRVLEYKVTDANFILQKEVRQRMLIHFYKKYIFYINLLLIHSNIFHTNVHVCQTDKNIQFHYFL